jgi:hypothetical protein
MAALVLELEGAGLLLVVLEPVDSELDDVEDTEVDEEVKVAWLMVVFLDKAVPVAAEPEPTAPVPIAAPDGAVVVALPADEGVVLLLPLPPTMPPDAGFVGTDDELPVLEPAEADEEVRAETARVGPLVEPPVRVIMPV